MAEKITSRINKSALLDQECDYQFEEEQKPQESHKAKVAILANFYALFISVYAVGAKILQQENFLFLDILLMRYFIAAILAFIVFKSYGRDLFQERTTWQDKRDLVARALIGLIDFSCFIFAAKYLPLFLLVLMQKSMGFWASIMGYFFFGDTLKWQEIAAMLFGYVGIFIIVWGHSPDEGGGDTMTEYNLWLGMPLSFLMSIFASLALVLFRKMRQIHFAFIHFTYSLFGTVVLGSILLFAFFSGSRQLEIQYDMGESAKLVVFSSFNGIGVLCGTLAFQVERAGIVAVISYISVLYSLLADIFIFGYPITGIQLAGGAVVLSSNLYIGFRQVKNDL